MKIKERTYDFEDWLELSTDLIHELGDEQALDDYIEQRYAVLLLHARSQNKVGDRIIIKWNNRVVLDLVLEPEDIIKK